MSWVRTLAAALSLSACGGVPHADNNQAAVSDRARVIWASNDLTDGVPEDLWGPGGKIRLTYRPDEVKVTAKGGKSVEVGVVPPASFLWRPNGDGVAINNGNGSGQMGHLIVVIDKNEPRSLEYVENDLKRFFVTETGCHVDAEQISVHVAGWSADSRSVWVRFENWDRVRFCDSSKVYFAEFDLLARAVRRHLASDSAYREFCVDPRFRADYLRNCATAQGSRSDGGSD